MDLIGLTLGWVGPWGTTTTTDAAAKVLTSAEVDTSLTSAEVDTTLTSEEVDTSLTSKEL